jgi:hypothetical protein
MHAAPSCAAYGPVSQLLPPFARHLARHGPTRSRVAGRVSLPGEIYMFSLVIGFGVATLCATVLLFLLQMLEDFGDA